MEMIKKIYEEINKKYKCSELYVEDFTAEQIFYQIEELCDKVIHENEIKINSLYGKFLKFNKKKSEIIKEEILEDKYEEVVNDISESSNEIENEDDYDDSDSFEEKKKLLDEEVSREYSSIEEDTLSEDGSIVDIGEIKDIPASEIFKKLDKNIK